MENEPRMKNLRVVANLCASSRWAVDASGAAIMFHGVEWHRLFGKLTLELNRRLVEFPHGRVQGEILLLSRQGKLQQRGAMVGSVCGIIDNEVVRHS